jgi:hypothetical protein
VTKRKTVLAVALAACALSVGGVEADPGYFPDDSDSNYRAPGDLLPNSGDGVPTQDVEIAGMRFPIEDAKAYANSQVYAHGGGEGPKPLTWDQKLPPNFQYPWRDNFCEKRAKLTQTEELCPQKKGVHQGQDIRAASSKRNKHWAVAAVTGKISKNNPKGDSATLDVKSADQNHFLRYLHLFDDIPGTETLPPPIQLPTRAWLGKQVQRGDRVGLVSAIMRYTDKNGKRVKYGTTTHLHFEIWEAGPDGYHRLPPYRTLVDAHARLLAGTP